MKVYTMRVPKLEEFDCKQKECKHRKNKRCTDKQAFSLNLGGLFSCMNFELKYNNNERILQPNNGN